MTTSSTYKTLFTMLNKFVCLFTCDVSIDLTFFSPSVGHNMIALSPLARPRSLLYHHYLN